MRTFVVVFLVLFFASVSPGLTEDVATMGIDELNQQLGAEDVIVIDVRAGRDWTSSEFKIKGAVREDPGDVSSWAGNYPKDKTYVLYCA